MPVLFGVAIGNALIVIFLLGGWFVDLIYALPGFPATDIALDDTTRRELAADGVAAIRPLGPGVDLLREADLASGAPAFNERELVHMEDVRRVVSGFAIAWLIGLLVTAFAWLSARRSGRSAVRRLRRAIRDAAVLVLGLIALTGLLLLIAFDPIFEGFHAIFFTADSWRFASDDTLLQLYPEMFWAAAGAAVVLLIASQCLALIRLIRP